ncbi:MAG: bifunctional riboflavin kinase/FAD synthetase [Candidatus Cyclobacteriaceae bacterium M2_1C_046]
MKIHEGFENIQPIYYAVVTSGTFDGVHVGHQKILQRLKEIAKKNNGETVVLTYWPHPRLVLYPGQTDLKLLNTFEEKAELLKEFGIDHLVKIPFTKEFSEFSGEQFIQDVIVNKIGTKKLVIGYDHRFGKNREGSFEYLKGNADRFGFEVEEIPPQDIDDVTVSSTKIRKALLNGNIPEASEFLGRNYQMSGKVVGGDRIGRQLGFPTANLKIEQAFKLIPGEGIYAVKVVIQNNTYGGMLYIGTRPTLNSSKQNIEVNIFNFDQDIYNATITVEFIRQIRTDMKFENLEQLKKQLEHDRKVAMEILNA